MRSACTNATPVISQLPPEYTEARWYAAYTCARHEKRVADFLAGNEVPHWLPLYTSIHRWKDRRVKLDLPLFDGYVFVHIPFRERWRVLQAPGVVRLVGSQGHATPIPSEVIHTLRSVTSQGLLAEPCPFLTIGRKVRIVRGPLAGTHGILVRKKQGFRIVLCIDAIHRSVSVEIDAADVEQLP